jgi:hypothetical protein
MVTRIYSASFERLRARVRAFADPKRLPPWERPTEYQLFKSEVKPFFTKETKIASDTLYGMWSYSKGFQDIWHRRANPKLGLFRQTWEQNLADRAAAWEMDEPQALILMRSWWSKWHLQDDKTTAHIFHVVIWPKALKNSAKLRAKRTAERQLRDAEKRLRAVERFEDTDRWAILNFCTEPRHIDEITEYTYKRKSTAKVAVHRLFKAGKLKKVSRGVYVTAEGVIEATETALENHVCGGNRNL